MSRILIVLWPNCTFFPGEKLTLLGKVKFLAHSAHSVDSKVYALFKMHQLSDIHINACFFYGEQIIKEKKVGVTWEGSSTYLAM